MGWVWAGLLSFLLGSIPSGLWLGRAVRGIDVREHGSGNLGATNVYRTLGPRWGISVLLLDAAKGVGAVLVSRAVGGTANPVLLGLLGMIGAALGHMFTPFAGFRGGKGVATLAEPGVPSPRSPSRSRWALGSGFRDYPDRVDRIDPGGVALPTCGGDRRRCARPALRYGVARRDSPDLASLEQSDQTAQTGRTAPRSPRTRTTNLS
ncbi:MAG: glycerol-3-phosphate acyltransferase [Candidatus Eisenbacteria bacterium]